MRYTGGASHCHSTVSLGGARVAPAGELRERDGQHERAAVEELLDEGLHAEQLQAGDPGDEEVDGRDRADRVEAARA